MFHAMATKFQWKKKFQRQHEFQWQQKFQCNGTYVPCDGNKVPIATKVPTATKISKRSKCTECLTCGFVFICNMGLFLRGGLSKITFFPFLLPPWHLPQSRILKCSLAQFPAWILNVGPYRQLRAVWKNYSIKLKYATTFEGCFFHIFMGKT